MQPSFGGRSHSPHLSASQRYLIGKLIRFDKTINELRQAGTELGKAQPKLGLGKVVAKLHNFGQ